MASTIDDVVEKGKGKGFEKSDASPAGSLSLDSRLASVGRGIRSAGRLALTGAVLVGTYAAIGKASLLTAGGNAVGYLIEKFKQRHIGQKMSDVVNEKEMHKEVRTGGLLGVVGYGLYSMIDFIPNYNTPLKVLKTVAFNPIMLAPYVAFYQAFTYLRDKVGAAKTAIGMVNMKIFKYLKDAYYNEIKPNFAGAMKKVMYLMPIHFASINYVQEVWKRVGIGVFNDIAFRIFQSKKKETSYSPAPSYSRYAAPQPAYG